MTRLVPDRQRDEVLILPLRTWVDGTCAISCLQCGKLRSSMKGCTPIETSEARLKKKPRPRLVYRLRLGMSDGSDCWMQRLRGRNASRREVGLINSLTSTNAPKNMHWS